MQGRSIDSPIKILTKKQEAFAMEYVANGGNATEAYLAVYSDNRDSARSAAQHVTNHPLVAQRIEMLKQQYLQSITIDPTTYVMSNLIELNETTITDFIDDKGKVMSLKNIPKSKAKAISKIKVTENTDTEGNTRKTYELTLIDRLQTIDKIAKHIGFYNTHTQGKYKQHLSSTRNIQGKMEESSEIINNIQHNYYQLPIEELEKQVNELS